MGSNFASFCVWVVEIDLISVFGIELDLISLSGSELTWFCVTVQKYLVLVCRSKITCFCVGASKLT